MLIVVSIGMKYHLMPDWVYYVLLTAASSIVFILSPVEDKNKPLYETEHRVCKRRMAFIAVIELVVCIGFKLTGVDNLFAAVYSFAILIFMIIAGKIKKYIGLSK